LTTGAVCIAQYDTTLKLWSVTGRSVASDHTQGTDTALGAQAENLDMNGYKIVDVTAIQPSADSTTAFQILDADGGTPILNVDSTNENIGIGTASPTAKLDVAGSFSNTLGIRTVNAANSSGLWVQLNGESTPEHTNQTGSFDYTGGAYENLFTKTAGDDFTQADADNGNWILLMGANVGAVAEIKTYIDASNVIVDGMGWTGDLASQSFYVMKHPIFVTGEGSKHEFSVEQTGEFEVHSYGFTGSKMIDFKNNVAADGSDTLHIVHNNNGYNNSDAVQIFYKTGDLQAGDHNQVIQISNDETGATGGEVDLLFLETTDATAVEKHAIHISTGFDTALTVSGASAVDPDYGYELSTGGTVATDRVNGGAGDGNAFLEAGNDLTIFDADNDWIIIGNDDTFEVLEVVLTTPSNKDCVLEFYYTSDGAGTWSPLVVDDGTQGFTKSGLIDWTAPVGWAEDDETDDGDAITEGYYIGIKRTYTPAIPTKPVEGHFKIYLEQGGNTGMKIDGQGVVKLPYITAAPSSLENGMMWMESDGLHIYYNGAEKLVAGA